MTFKTDLVDMSINVGKIGIDWGGNYSLDGKETLSAALDLAGFLDPTGVADGANALLLASDGDYWGAIQSGLSLLPLGDLAKAPKLGKDIGIISDAVNKTHKHHIVPKAVYKNNIDDLKDVLKRDSKVNLIILPAGFHGNHPAYNDWVQGLINEKKKSGQRLTQSDIQLIMSKALDEILKSKESGLRLNTYFTQLNQ